MSIALQIFPASVAITKRGSGNLAIEVGKTLTFRYRVVLHRGDSQSVPLEALYRSYAAEKDLK